MSSRGRPRASRRRRHAVTAVALAAALTGGAGPALAGEQQAPRAGATADGAATAELSLIVQAHPGSAPGAQALAVRLGGQVTAELPVIDGFAVRLPADAVGTLRRSPLVRTITRDGRITLNSTAPSLGYDPVSDFGSMHSVQRVVGAHKVWKAGYTGKGVDIAMIDTGVAPVAGLTSGNVVHGPDLSFESQHADGTRTDTFGHGTHMASIAVGRDAAGTPASYADPATFEGVAPDARLVSLKVGAQDGAVDVSQVIAAINWVAQHSRSNGYNIRVLNLSFGTDGVQSYQLDPLAYAAEVAMRKGVLVVVSSGNLGRTDRRVLANPAYSPHVLTVGAVQFGTELHARGATVPPWVSSGTDRTRMLDLVAPGASLLGLRVPGSWIDDAYPVARVGERFFSGSGTSQAAAVTSGAAALLFQKYPLLNAYMAKAQLVHSATALPQESVDRQGNGLLNIEAAVGPLQIQVLTKVPTPGSGTGTLELARGSSHVTDEGVDLTGEFDIMGRPWAAADWARLAADNRAWNGGTFNGAVWTGTGTTGADWDGAPWTGTSWSGKSWSSGSWSGKSWSGTSWSGKSWSGKSWSSGSWAGKSWSAASWDSGS